MRSYVDGGASTRRRVRDCACHHTNAGAGNGHQRELFGVRRTVRVLAIMGLTDEQQAVIAASEQRMLVNAYAGTGKTETTAHRVARSIEQGRKVLLLCFTRAAQQQLSARLDSLGVRARVSTIHSFSHDVVRRWHERHSAVMPEIVGDAFMRRLLIQSGFAGSGANAEAIKRASTFIANGMTSGFTQSDEFDGKTARALVEAYAAEKQRRNKIDFDDLVGMATEIVGAWSGEIIVDEAQDLSNIQLRLLDALTDSDTTVSWIGDRWQSIFGFAGVDADLFRKRSEWTQFTLSKSFRSTREVLTIANQLISDRIASDIIGGKVEVRQRSQADTMGDLLSWCQGGDAILARTNAELDEIARVLSYEHVPHTRMAFDSHDAMTERKRRATTLLTIHSAKGLEFERVAVVGLNGRSFGAFEASAEEARLFYVAATRAKSALTLFTQDGDLPFEVEA